MTVTFCNSDDCGSNYTQVQVMAPGHCPAQRCKHALRSATSNTSHGQPGSHSAPAHVQIHLGASSAPIPNSAWSQICSSPIQVHNPPSQQCTGIPEPIILSKYSNFPSVATKVVLAVLFLGTLPSRRSGHATGLHSERSCLRIQMCRPVAWPHLLLGNVPGNSAAGTTLVATDGKWEFCRA